jgi:hypothetical protein
MTGAFPESSRRTPWVRSLLSLGLRVVLLVTLLNACTKGDSGEGQVAQPSVPRFQNLLFLLIDTLRSDHLPSYG